MKQSDHKAGDGQRNCKATNRARGCDNQRRCADGNHNRACYDAALWRLFGRCSKAAAKIAELL